MSKLPFNLTDEQLTWFILHRIFKCKGNSDINFLTDTLSWDEESTDCELGFLCSRGYIEKWKDEYILTKKGKDLHDRDKDIHHHTIRKKVTHKSTLQPALERPKRIEDYFNYKPHDNTGSKIPEASLKPIGEIFFDPEVIKTIISEGAKGKGQTDEGRILNIRPPRKNKSKRITGNKITIDQFATVHDEIINTIYFFEREALRSTRNAIAKCIGISNNDYYRQATADLIESGFIAFQNKNLLSCTKNGMVYLLDHSNLSKEFTQYELKEAMEGQTTGEKGANKVCDEPLTSPTEEGQTFNREQVPLNLLEMMTPEAVDFLTQYWMNLHKIKITMPIASPRPPDKILKDFLGAYEIPLNNWSKFRKQEDYFFYEITTKSITIFTNITIWKSSPSKCSKIILDLISDEIVKIEKAINTAISEAKKKREWKNTKIPPFKIKCCNFEHDDLEPIAKVSYHQAYPLHPAAIIISETPRGLEVAQKLNTPNFSIDASLHHIPGVGKVRMPEVEASGKDHTEIETQFKRLKVHHEQMAKDPRALTPVEIASTLNNQLQNQSISSVVTQNQDSRLNQIEESFEKIISIQDKVINDSYNRHLAHFLGGVEARTRIEQNTEVIHDVREELKNTIKLMNKFVKVQTKKKIRRKRKLKQKPLSRWQRFKNLFKVKRWKKNRSGSHWTTTSF